MTDTAALLADEVLPQKPRPWVLSLPFAQRFLLATEAEALTQVLGIVYRTISTYVLKKAHGAYLVGTEPPVFRRGAPPGEGDLQALVARLVERIGGALERRGVLVRDASSSFLELEPAAGGPIDDLLGHSITYRVAIGSRAGQKVLSLRAVRSPFRD